MGKQFELDTIDPALVRILRLIGGEWGPAGVAGVAAVLAEQETAGTVAVIAGRHVSYEDLAEFEDTCRKHDRGEDIPPMGEGNGANQVTFANEYRLPADEGSGWTRKPTAGELGLCGPTEPVEDESEETVSVPADRLAQLEDYERRITHAGRVPMLRPEDFNSPALTQVRGVLWPQPVTETPVEDESVLRRNS